MGVWVSVGGGGGLASLKGFCSFFDIFPVCAPHMKMTAVRWQSARLNCFGLWAAVLFFFFCLESKKKK